MKKLDISRNVAAGIAGGLIGFGYYESFYGLCLGFGIGMITPIVLLLVLAFLSGL